MYGENWQLVTDQPTKIEVQSVKLKCLNTSGNQTMAKNTGMNITKGNKSGLVQMVYSVYCLV